MSEDITATRHERPTEAEDILGRVSRRELAPLLEAVAELRADLGLTNGATRSVLHRVTELEERVSRLELTGAPTERPSYTDSTEPGGDG